LESQVRTAVRAFRGKALRAEPVAALIDQTPTEGKLN
jgi:phage terminase large subunit-like protein